MLLSEIVKDEMSKRSLSIKDMAECTGLTENKIRSYTLGTIPKKDDLKKVCDAIGVDPDTLVFDNLNISVEECAKTMGKASTYVKYLVRKGVFGSTDGTTYHIPRKKFEQYMGMIEMLKVEEVTNMLAYALKTVIKDLIKETFKQEKADALPSTQTN